MRPYIRCVSLHENMLACNQLINTVIYMIIHTHMHIDLKKSFFLKSRAYIHACKHTSPNLIPPQASTSCFPHPPSRCSATPSLFASILPLNPEGSCRGGIFWSKTLKRSPACRQPGRRQRLVARSRPKNPENRKQHHQPNHRDIRKKTQKYVVSEDRHRRPPTEFDTIHTEYRYRIPIQGSVSHLMSQCRKRNATHFRITSPDLINAEIVCFPCCRHEMRGLGF